MITIVRKAKHYIISSINKIKEIEIVFTHRDESGALVEGCTREDIYLMLLDKIHGDNATKWNRENDIQIRHIESALQSQRVVITNNISRKNAGGNKKQIPVS